MHKFVLDGFNNMNFLKYLQNSDITTVLDKLVKKHVEYNEGVNISAQVEGYLTLILKLLYSEANVRHEKIYVERFVETYESFDGFVRVDGRMLDIYFWENELQIEDLLGMEIVSSYNLEDTVAYLIFELTFCGFEPEQFGDLSNG